jgi:putative Mg2+ transporter-C (MgtC) family protein
MEIITRVGLAFLVGLVLGVERERHGRAAGMRTTALVSIASAIAMLISELEPGRNIERFQMAAGILTGMGFLGAGAILKSDRNIRGLSTAATLWVATVLGLAFGAGQFFLASIGTAVAIFTLLVLRYVQSYFENDWFVKLTILSSLNTPSEQQLTDQFGGLRIKIITVDRALSIRRDRRKLVFGLRMRQCDELNLSKLIIDKFATIPGVLAVNWR